MSEKAIALNLFNMRAGAKKMYEEMLRRFALTGDFPAWEALTMATQEHWERIFKAGIVAATRTRTPGNDWKAVRRNVARKDTQSGG